MLSDKIKDVYNDIIPNLEAKYNEMALKIKNSDIIFEKFINAFESIKFTFFKIDKDEIDLLKEDEFSKKLNEFEFQISKI